MRSRDLPRPVLKWAGGKSQLLDAITSRLPERIDTYYEPFVGGGAVFFRLAQQGRFARAVLADRNPELIEVYRAVQENVEGVIDRLAQHARAHDSDYYYRVREAKPRGLAQRAARLIYLNKTGYNGLYRVNRSGKFNVPCGRYANPRILDEENLRAVAEALRNVALEVADFEVVCARAVPGDAVYLDPPYLPVSPTSNFTAYDRHPFGLVEHERLAATFARMAEGGIRAVLSNSSTPATRDLYREFRFDEVPVSRPINSRASARGPIDEILVVNDRRKPYRARRPQL